MLVRREWEPEDLIASWTLVDDDCRLVGNKSGATRLGFSVLLKFFELEVRFLATPARYPRPRSGTWPGRSRSSRVCSASTSGRAAPSSITVPRSGRRWGSGSRPGPMRNG